MDCVVESNEKLCDGFHYLSLAPDVPLGIIKPGQFVMVRVADSVDPFLRRPMSVADFEPDGSRFGLLIQVTGKGTFALSSLAAGERLDVLGPFGTSFDIPEKYKKVSIVAGGCGVAPFMGLVDHTPAGSRDYTLFLGARRKDLILYKNRFEDRGARVITATEDGSDGFTGLVTDCFRNKLDEEERPDIILTCGPTPMMSEVKKIAVNIKTPLLASLENQMACGFGACLGCVVKVTGKDWYITTCKEGPVLDAYKVEI